MAKDKRNGPAIMFEKFNHKQIYLYDRGHTIDFFILPVCQKLWDAGIPTYYSCQGGAYGIRKNDKFIPEFRAYVQVRVKDAKKARKILKKLGLDPKIDNVKKPDKRRNKKRICIRFEKCDINTGIS